MIDSGVWGDKGLVNDRNGDPRILAIHDAITDELVTELHGNGKGSGGDENGHGTHVASVAVNSRRIGGLFNGIAPDANLVVVKAFDKKGEGNYADVIRGLDFVLRNKDRLGIRVVNLSFSAPPRSAYFDDPLNQTVMRVWQAGIVVVASAGNTGPFAMTIGVPGNVPYVITVGALTDRYTPDNRGDDRLTWFSAAGPTHDGFVKPDLVAPGGHVRGIMNTEAVHAIVQSSRGLLWFGTQDGLNRYDGYQITIFNHDPRDPTSLSDGWIWSLFEDSLGNLWIGTDGGGLNRFLPDREAFERFVSDPSDPSSLSHDHIRVIYEDTAGMLWIGTDDGGLNRLDPATRRFTRFAHDPSNPASLSNDRVRTITEDASGALWVSTDGGGINIFDSINGNFRHLRHDDSVPHSLSDDRVRVIRETADGAIWVGTYENGLDRLAVATERFTHFVHAADDGQSLTNDNVRDLFQDSMGTLWVATDGGLSTWVQETQSFVQHVHDPLDRTSLSDNRVDAVIEDRGGVLWVGTYNGVNQWNLAMGAIALYEPANGLDSGVIRAFTEDSRDRIWIGTKAAGLNYWDPSNRRAHIPTFRRYLRSDGLPSSVVYGILGDDQDNVWLSTSRGLTRLNPATGHVKNYDVSHGLQGNEFNHAAQFRSRDGRLFFGGSNGFNAFHPDRVRDNDHAPPVILTEFLKFNEAVPLDGPTDSSIQLTYKDSMIAFEFAALDFTAPERNQYRYKLEGFDNDWNNVGVQRRATYTNLPAGEYTLRVQAANNDVLWNEEGLALAIVVGTPPWWSWWAILLYVLCAAAAVLAFVRRQANRLERQAEYSHRLEQEVAKRTDELESQNREFAELNHQLQEVSVTDSLTGLWNRRYLANEIPKDLALMHRARIDSQSEQVDHQDGPYSNILFLMMDLDGLKAVNDTYGHQAGDRAIVQMKDILVQVCRKSDTLIRWGGDEFLLVGRQTDRDAAALLAERIRQAVSAHRFDLDDGDTVRLSCSIGFAFFPFMPGTPSLFSWEQVLNMADRALYHAKQAGRNRWVGVLNASNVDPSVAMSRKNDDLEQLARKGIIELHTGAGTPSGPDRTHRPLELLPPQVVGQMG